MDQNLIKEIKGQTDKDISVIDNYIREYSKHDRNQRGGQLERIQIAKRKDDGSLTEMVKIIIPHAKNITETLASFVVGKAVTLLPSVNNKLSDLVRNIWRTNRLDSKLLESTIVKFSQTQVAINFYMVDSDSDSLINKLSETKQAKEIKSKVLDNSKGAMYPYFDDSGDMTYFLWEFKTKEDGKDVLNIQIWDNKNMYWFKNDTLIQEKPHGFSKIPIAYDVQDEPIWYDVTNAIDRHEVALSKLGDANDYSGHPILITEGVVNSLPTKYESGKHFNIEIGFDSEGKQIKGDARFLEAQTAPESNRLEIEKLEDAIAYGSGVPNLSIDKLKSLGNVAEKTIKLMFLATDIKASLQQTKTKVFIERCLNIIISGILTTTNQSMINDSKDLFFDVQFNSILPSDLSETITMVTTAVTGGVMSKNTGIKMIDKVNSVEDELNLIKEEQNLLPL